jgi:hypothetical protein
VLNRKVCFIRPCLFGIISQIVARFNPRLFTHTKQKQSHALLLELFTCHSTKHTAMLTLQLNNSGRHCQLTKVSIYSYVLQKWECIIALLLSIYQPQHATAHTKTDVLPQHPHPLRCIADMSPQATAMSTGGNNGCGWTPGCAVRWA